MKVCNKCKEELPNDSFNKNKSAKDGLHYSCKACRAEDRKKYKGDVVPKKPVYKMPSREEIITAIKESHGEAYTFDDAEFGYWTTKATITCVKHGNFTMAPVRMKGANPRGCPRCGKDRATKAQTSNTDTFIEKAKKVHGDKYDYSTTSYRIALAKVDIICPIHGKFSQTPGHHLSGKGCVKCGNVKVAEYLKENGSNGWSYSEWEEAGTRSGNFDGFRLYLIKCSSEDEVFYKIGKTFVPLSSRFKPSVMPYAYVEVFTVVHNAYAISSLEKELHKRYRKYKYTPNTPFGGATECFSLCNDTVAALITSLSEKYKVKVYEEELDVKGR